VENDKRTGQKRTSGVYLCREAIPQRQAPMLAMEVGQVAKVLCGLDRGVNAVFL